MWLIMTPCELVLMSVMFLPYGVLIAVVMSVNKEVVDSNLTEISGLLTLGTHG